jgi:hypothetical protein
MRCSAFAAGVAFAGGKKKSGGKIVLMTAGDTNMLAIQQNVFGPMFAEKNPGTSLISVHTGRATHGLRESMKSFLPRANQKKLHGISMSL